VRNASTIVVLKNLDENFQDFVEDFRKCRRKELQKAGIHSALPKKNKPDKEKIILLPVDSGLSVDQTMAKRLKLPKNQS